MGEMKKNESSLNNNQTWLTKNQAAARCGVCERTIENWITQRKLARIKIGRSVRIPISALKELERNALLQADPIALDPKGGTR